MDKAYPPIDESETVKVKSDLQQKFEEIKKYIQYRKVLFSSWDNKNTPEVKAAIMGDETVKIPCRRPTICEGTIVLDPLEPIEKPYIKSSASGREYLTIKEKKGAINFAMNRETGEIGYWGISHIALSDVIPERQYLAIKRDIYEYLLHYLKSKDPDIEDLFAKHEPPERLPSEVGIEIQQGVQAAIYPEVQDIEEISEETTSDVDEVASELEYTELEEVTAKSGETLDAEDERKEKYHYLRQLKGLKGRKALSALRKLLGAPYSIQGSHYMFRSKKNGKILPFPIHKSKDIAFPIFVSNLQALDYDLADFCKKL